MRVNRLNHRSNHEDSRREHERLLASQSISDRPDNQTSHEGAGLLETDCERVDPGLVRFGVAEVGGERSEGEDTA